MLCEYLRAHEDTVYMYAGGVIDEEYSRSISAFAEEHSISEQVMYVGELAPGKELNAYYNAADCSVFTSNLESFGLVIIEAISSGTPVIVGSNLMFELDGGYSIYRTEEEFVALVDTALRENSSRTDTSCRASAERYSWDNATKMHLQILQELN